MPLFKFRLEAQDGSGHFRAGTIESVDEVAAAEVLRERELKYVAFRADDPGPPPPPRDAPDEERAAFRAIPSRERAHSAIHHQTEPYLLIEIEEVI